MSSDLFVTDDDFPEDYGASDLDFADRMNSLAGISDPTWRGNSPSDAEHDDLMDILTADNLHEAEIRKPRIATEVKLSTELTAIDEYAASTDIDPNFVAPGQVFTVQQKAMLARSKTTQSVAASSQPLKSNQTTPESGSPTCKQSNAGGNKPCSSRKPVAKNAREAYLQRTDNDRVEKTRKNGQKSKSHLSKMIQGKSKHANENRLGVSRRILQGSGDGSARRTLSSLIGYDPIKERLTNPVFNVSLAPQITSSLKKDQRNLLIEGLPPNTDIRLARSDRAKLMRASQSFGHAKMKAVDGKWLLSGMKVCRKQSIILQ